MNTETSVIHIETQVRGRVLLDLPKNSITPEKIILGFHGYAETAESLLPQLQSIRAQHPWLLASIQALHPFYVRKTGEVVSSWMTRQDRELAIADNILYVENTFKEVKKQAPENTPVYLLGFSQGGATAFRVNELSKIKTSGLIVLGSDVPPEFADRKSLRKTPILHARGSNDPHFTADQFASDVAILRKYKLPVEELVFDGGHEFTKEFYEKSRNFILD